MAAAPGTLLLERQITILTPPARVIAAFFDPNDLAAWFGVARSVTLPRSLGPFALQWSEPTTTTTTAAEESQHGVDTLHGTVMDFDAARSLFVADVYWQPHDGDPVGPMALTVQAWPAEGPGTLLIVRQSAEDAGPRWQEYFAVMHRVWEHALERLKRHLEGR
jgi:uncharacterized protein YndB with AHSA1/START domain